MGKFDLLVVGAGSAGCLAASKAAEAGLNVCLIDLKSTSEVGKKICGDAIGKHHFENLGLEEPRKGEFEGKVLGIKIFSPDTRTVFNVMGEGLHGYLLNRHVFGQKLLKLAIQKGAVFLERTLALEPIIEKGFVTGVLAKNLEKNEKMKLYAKVTVDASGYTAVLRKKLPLEIGITPHTDKEEYEACYREIRELKEEVEDERFCEIYLNQNVAPGGYYWIFPKNKMKVNVGIGVAMKHEFPNPKEQLYKHVLTRELFRGSRVLDGGSWCVPTRRPLDSMVGNGIIVAGDAACQVNPIHGGGIGPSMAAGVLAAQTVVEALEGGDWSRGGLWRYNVRFMSSYGAKQAALDIFRIFLQACSDEEINYGMQYRLITERDVLKASQMGDIRLNLTEKTLRIFRGLRRLGFLKKLKEAADLMKKAKNHYLNYPEKPEEFENWKVTTQSIIEEAKVKFGSV